MTKIVIVIIAVTYMAWFAAYILAEDSPNHDHDHSIQAPESSGQDHENHETQDDSVDNHDHNENKDNDDHSGHDHGDHEAYEDELSIQLTSEGIKLAGIEISKVVQRKMAKTIELPGEIGFNEDRLAHISPRFAGIAIQANYRVGDYVEKGDVVAVVESNESMNSYSIKAPISGWIIERHITAGEFVSEENSIFVIADLSTVWVNLAVYPKDESRVAKGQAVIIRAIGTDNVIADTIEFISPMMDFHTRSATARVILPNPDNVWKPGTFVQAMIDSEAENESLVIEKKAVQYLDEQSVVFVADGPNRYKPVEVITGDSDARYIQILDGLSENSEYVSEGAFELKARIVTSNLDAHAGHGH